MKPPMKKPLPSYSIPFELLVLLPAMPNPRVLANATALLGVSSASATATLSTALHSTPLMLATLSRLSTIGQGPMPKMESSKQPLLVSISILLDLSGLPMTLAEAIELLASTYWRCWCGVVTKPKGF